jgi:hypothetical protein
MLVNGTSPDPLRADSGLQVSGKHASVPDSVTTGTALKFRVGLALLNAARWAGARGALTPAMIILALRVANRLALSGLEARQAQLRKAAQEVFATTSVATAACSPTGERCR